jgi:excisionase family DNA binding protein
MTAVSRRLGVSRSTAYEMVADGRLPALRGRRGLYVPRAALEAFLAAEADAALDNLEANEGVNEAQRR